MDIFCIKVGHFLHEMLSTGQNSEPLSINEKELFSNMNWYLRFRPLVTIQRCRSTIVIFRYKYACQRSTIIIFQK